MFSLNYVGIFVRHFVVIIFLNKHKKATFSILRVAYNNVDREVFSLKRRSSASQMFVLNFISNLEKVKLRLYYTLDKFYKKIVQFRDLGLLERHYLENLDRQVVHLHLGYFILFISQFYKQ